MLLTLQLSFRDQRRQMISWLVFMRWAQWPHSWLWADVSSAGVELEEAGEKWRAGDATKSCRFFSRAIDMYDAGLRHHSHSFDLAYNKYSTSSMI
jgi:hypothetical protein